MSYWVVLAARQWPFVLVPALALQHKHCWYLPPSVNLYSNYNAFPSSILLGSKQISWMQIVWRDLLWTCSAQSFFNTINQKCMQNYTGSQWLLQHFSMPLALCMSPVPVTPCPVTWHFLSYISLMVLSSLIYVEQPRFKLLFPVNLTAQEFLLLGKIL